MDASHLQQIEPRASALDDDVARQAELLLADEYDAAQERGEVATAGEPVNVPDGNNKPTATGIGISRKDIHEARQLRDAEAAQPGVIREALDAQLEAGEEPTRAAVRRRLERQAR